MIPLMSPITFLADLDELEQVEATNGAHPASPKSPLAAATHAAALGDVSAIDALPPASPTGGRVDELDAADQHGRPTEAPHGLTHAQHLPADGQAGEQAGLGLALANGVHDAAEDANAMDTSA